MDSVSAKNPDTMSQVPVVDNSESMEGKRMSLSKSNVPNSIKSSSEDVRNRTVSDNKDDHKDKEQGHEDRHHKHKHRDHKNKDCEHKHKDRDHKHKDREHKHKHRDHDRKEVATRDHKRDEKNKDNKRVSSKSTKEQVKKEEIKMKMPSSSSIKRKSPNNENGRKRKIIKRTEDDFEPTNMWWEKQGGNEDDFSKWGSLEHRGMMFAPSYEPHNIPLIYEGQATQLPPEAEEVATFFAQTLGTPWYEKKKFVDNFWKEFIFRLPKGTNIKKFEKCDFAKIKEYIDKKSAERKSRSKDEKEAEAEKKKVADFPFTHALVDELREKVGNCKVEPPTLFRGRGEHPKMGLLKKRIMPEDVTLNIGPDAPAPKAIEVPGHAYGDVVHDNTVTWLAWYSDSINGLFKYVFLNAASGFKGQSDWGKYEKARKLKNFISQIRSDYEKKVTSKDKHDRQVGTVAYLIDRLALRVGNEKNTEEEADTVGCCSLRVEHMKFSDKTREITLDFLGKDSIRYFNTVKIQDDVYKDLCEFVSNKKNPEDTIFDIDPDDINKYFKEFMPELSAKVFRTYNASVTLEAELKRMVEAGNGETGNVNDLVKLYNDANRRVAILCNHQRAPPKQHEAGMAKLSEKLADSKTSLEALLAHREHSLGKSLSDKQKLLRSSHATGKDMTADQLVRKIAQQKVSIERLEFQISEKEENKTVSLTTSKINYMDPRITVAFCKKNELPIEKVFAKTIRNKFPWAMHTKMSWSF